MKLCKSEDRNELSIFMPLPLTIRPKWRKIDISKILTEWAFNK